MSTEDKYAALRAALTTPDAESLLPIYIGRKEARALLADADALAEQIERRVCAEDVARQASDALARERARTAHLTEGLTDAIECVENWARVATDYLREECGREDIARLRAYLTEPAPTPPPASAPPQAPDV